MGSPTTEGGYNLFDMLSLMQKAIRRGMYEEAGFAADQLKKTYRNAMWNRLFVISSEDCYGILTKEILRLRKENTDDAIARAIALMCRGKKSRDACYFSCNFVLVSRKPMEYKVDPELVKRISKHLSETPKERVVYDSCGFEQMTLFDLQEDTEEDETAKDIARLMKALDHRDMDMIGFYMDKMRYAKRDELWQAFHIYIGGEDSGVASEIEALCEADGMVNRGKKDKDEIFISKAAMVLTYWRDPAVKEIYADEIIPEDGEIDWGRYRIKPVWECKLKSGVPEWVYDCHTLKGKKMGKTDWDMTRTEQKALKPLMDDYFSEASWAYTYEDDYEKGIESYDHMVPIWAYGSDHPVNPVEPFPYDDDDLEEEEPPADTKSDWEKIVESES